MTYLWGLRPGRKRGAGGGTTKNGKGGKWMVVVDGQGVPLGSHIDSAKQAEVTLVDKTLDNIRVHNGRKGRPKRLVADKGYDCDPLRVSLGKRGIELISPYRMNRKDQKAFRQSTRERDTEDDTRLNEPSPGSAAFDD